MIRFDWYNKHSFNDGKNWYFFQNALLPHQKCGNKLIVNLIRLCLLDKESKTQHI